MEWISVERKLPDSDASVLVTTGKYIAIAHWDVGEGRFVMMSREDAALILSQEVTHWTPLPELPQERHNDWSRDRPKKLFDDASGFVERRDRTHKR
jgi:hypothetical protein